MRSIIFCQSLIVNGSFEDYDVCPKTFTEKGQILKIPGWYSPSKGTPDYFNICSKINVNVPVNLMGHQWAKEGNAYIGLISAEHPDIKNNRRTRNYREYIQTELKSSLKKDSIYKLSFYLSLAPNSKFALNYMGAAITCKKLKGRHTVILTDKVVACTDTSKIITERGDWFLVESVFKANGGEKFLTIGNFIDDDQMKYELLNISDLRKSLQEKINFTGVAYYYVDDVSLVITGIKE